MAEQKIPTEAEVRHRYAEYTYLVTGESDQAYGTEAAAFDEFLREERRKAFQEGVEALALWTTKPTDPTTGYRPPLVNPHEKEA